MSSSSISNRESKLGLFNFDSPHHSSSRYILTSPRSLKACSRLGIKPLDLLPKSLPEFTQSAPASLTAGHGGHTVKAVYDEWERDRRGKLQAARRERERIITEQGNGSVEILTIPSKTVTSQRSWRQEESAPSYLDGDYHHQPLSLTGANHYGNSAELVARTKYQKLREKQLNDEKRRKLQEERLSDIESERQLMAAASYQYWRDMEDRAHENRATRVNSVSMEKQLKRSKCERRHQEKMAELEDELRAQNESLKNYLDHRDKVVEERYLTQRKHREDSIRYASECREKRAVKARQVLEEMESELEQWRRELETRHHSTMDQAHRASQRVVEKRSRRAQSARLDRERAHWERMEALKSEDQERRLQYSQEILAKTQRSESIAMEKQSFLDQTRRAASRSSLRESHKDKYLRKSFDRMALEAELRASLERRHTPRRQRSNTVIG